MTQAQLTPVAIQTPALAEVTDELSGAQWCSRYLASTLTSELIPTFQASCEAFIAALKTAGASVHIANTYRPLERAYLMHWAHKIARNGTNPASVPPMNGVNIEWVHPTNEASLHAAWAMVNAYGIQGLAANTAPALDTLHSHREAIDMSISWSHNLEIAKQDGTMVTITSLPRTGMNSQLKEVGRSYGVIKFVGGANDRPHWSTTGH